MTQTTTPQTAHEQIRKMYDDAWRTRMAKEIPLRGRHNEDDRRTARAAQIREDVLKEVLSILDGAAAEATRS